MGHHHHHHERLCFGDSTHTSPPNSTNKLAGQMLARVQIPAVPFLSLVSRARRFLSHVPPICASTVALSASSTSRRIPLAVNRLHPNIYVRSPLFL